jgi:hypothetical protein
MPESLLSENKPISQESGQRHAGSIRQMFFEGGETIIDDGRATTTLMNGLWR